MKKTLASATIVALVAAVSVAVAYAGPGPKWHGSGGWGMGGPYGRMYDAKAVETISGRIVKIEQITPMRRMSAGIHAIVKTDAGEISVHLGPAWYIERQDVKLEPGDMIEVKGARVSFAGKPAIIASEVKKGEETLRLRDEAGVPAWAGWRRG